VASTEELEARVKRLEHELLVLKDIEAIKQLKGKYFRCLDSKLWNELAECFTEDATSSYSGGKYSFNGRDAIIKFLSEGMLPSMISMHQGHHPEIEFTGPSSAKGVWSFEDYLIIGERNRGLRGAAFYQDEYVKVAGQWKIKHTGYNRIFEEVWDRGETKSLKITQNMHERNTA
jgi:bile-acid 7alpha-dehydratase